MHLTRYTEMKSISFEGHFHIYSEGRGMQPDYSISKERTNRKESSGNIPRKPCGIRERFSWCRDGAFSSKPLSVIIAVQNITPCTTNGKGGLFKVLGSLYSRQWGCEKKDVPPIPCPEGTKRPCYFNGQTSIVGEKRTSKKPHLEPFNWRVVRLGSVCILIRRQILWILWCLCASVKRGAIGEARSCF